MTKDRLSVAHLIISKTLSEMKAVDTLPKFSDMSYNDIERNLYTVTSHVSGHGEHVKNGLETLDVGIPEIILSVKSEILPKSAEFEEVDWMQTYSLACELISQATLQVHQK